MEKVLEGPLGFPGSLSGHLLLAFYFFLLRFKCMHTPDCIEHTLDCRGQRTACWGWVFPAQLRSRDWTQVLPQVTLRSGSSWHCLLGLHQPKPCSFSLLGSFICSANDFQEPLCSPGSALGPGTVSGNQTDGRLCTSLGLTFSCGSQAINTQITGTQAM